MPHTTIALLATALLTLTFAACDSSEPSSYKIEHLIEGKGPSPDKTQKVSVHYKGTLADGTVFDSSFKRGKPATFPLNRVIPCWTQGLQEMKAGGKARLTCPPEIAYGKKGTKRIPPDSTIYFEVELLEVL
jgi:FKBP-type peptidyl-prolyl cis-trans isomerase FkpA